MSEVTNKIRLQVGREYTVTYDPDSTAISTVDVVAVFEGKGADGILYFKPEHSDSIALSPEDIGAIIPLRNNRIYSKVKMGKPTGKYKPTERVQNPTSGKIHEVCVEEAAIMVRTFGFRQLG